MDRYHKVEKPRPESTINENEIRITSQGVIRNYVSYATSLLQDYNLDGAQQQKLEKRVREIVLKAMGQAISKAVAIAEIIKKRFPGLHQDTAISSVSITDVWEPIEEGLVPLETTRHVSMISISLSTRELDKNSPGYQVPLEQPRRQQRYQQQRPQQQQQFQPKREQDQYNEDAYAPGRGRGRGRGRERGRGRGWGRGYGGYGGYDYNQGGYDNYQGGYGGYGYNQGGYGGYGHEQENGEWNPNWGRGGGRGSGGWNYRGGGYGGGRGGSVRAGGRGYGRGRGRMGSRGRGNQV